MPNAQLKQKQPKQEDNIDIQEDLLEKRLMSLTSSNTFNNEDEKKII